MNNIIFNKQTKWIAHRGLSYKYPENSIPAFENAAMLPFYGIETDIHILKDRQIVTHHDDYILVNDDTKYYLKDHDYETLNKLIMDKTGEKLPTLKEYLLICKKYNTVPVIEIKPLLNFGDVKYVIEYIKNYISLKEIIIITFHLDNLIDIYNIDKTIKGQYLISKIDDELIDKALKYGFDFDIYHAIMNAELVSKIRKHDRLINCWTLNNEQIVKGSLNFKVDFITTDGFD
ncbi:MAG: glycerophosphodiester phosphodiesterase family protein [Bacilli bacterium]